MKQESDSCLLYTSISNASFWSLKKDGSGFLAKGNISWTKDGVLSVEEMCIRDSSYVQGQGTNTLTVCSDYITDQASSYLHFSFQF